jgi:hypothetical protein
MAKGAYQFCILDPEGDYETFESAINLGNPHYVPSAEDVLSLLERMDSTVVNLLGVSLDATSGRIGTATQTSGSTRPNRRPHGL